MITHRGIDCVGSWIYALPCDDWGRGRVSCLVDHLAAVVAAAAEARLLFAPYQIIPHWPRREAPHAVVVPDASSLIANVGASLGAGCTWLDVLGSGEVIGPAGSTSYQSGIVDVSLSVADDAATLYVKTRCDAWLKYDLQARPQPEIWVKNSPRLKDFLAWVQERTGEVGFGENSRFAQCEGYTLRNQGDEDDPADLEDLGYTEEFVRES